MQLCSSQNILTGHVNAYRALSSIHEADDTSDREQTDTAVETTNTGATNGSNSESGGGCFIASTGNNSSTVIQLTVMMIIGIFATLVAAKKKRHRKHGIKLNRFIGKNLQILMELESEYRRFQDAKLNKQDTEGKQGLDFFSCGGLQQYRSEQYQTDRLF
ncbi:MAG: hypothetical protein JRI91_12245 [Deltaproteobacteria bacterium]|nr:hypothetical protein [Deltaproteobacteria bacterium]